MLIIIGRIYFLVDRHPRGIGVWVTLTATNTVYGVLDLISFPYTVGLLEPRFEQPS